LRNLVWLGPPEPVQVLQDLSYLRENEFGSPNGGQAILVESLRDPAGFLQAISPTPNHC
jgi:hypothetical protein